MTEAVKNSGKALQFASNEVRNDKEVVLEAMEQDNDALEFASDEVKIELLLETEKAEYVNALEYLSDARNLGLLLDATTLI